MNFINRLKPYLPIGTVIFVFFLIILFVNPLREGSTKDDWAYALSVRSLLQTGVNAPYIWFPTYFPMHTYWGGLFSLILGYSFASLRISTVVLMLAGLAAFYFLALECGIGPWSAALLSLVMLANPLVLWLAFTYMTEIPVMVWLIVALVFFARGLRLGSVPLMLAGSAAAGAAILTRFNMWAFLPALLLVWLLDKDRRKRWHLYFAGASIAALTALYMLDRIVFHPTGDTDVSVQAQNQYVQQVGSLLLNANRRMVGLLELMALFTLPLMVLIVLQAALNLPQWVRRAERRLLLFGIVVGCLVYVAGVVAFLSWKQSSMVTLPLLTASESTMYNRISSILPPLSVVAGLGAAALGAVFIWRHVGRTGWHELSTGERLIDLVTLFLLGSILLLFRDFDRYLVILWPYAVLVAGLHLWRRWGSSRLWVLSVPLLVVMLVISSLWVRRFLALNEARWNASEQLVERGVPPDEISNGWEWNSYHGAYDTYLSNRKQRHAFQTEYIQIWLPKYLAPANYLVDTRLRGRSVKLWTVIETVDYDHLGFPDLPIMVYERISEK